MVYKRNFHFMKLAVTACIMAFLLSGCTAFKRVAEPEVSLQYASMWEPEEAQAEYLKEVASNFEKETGIRVKFKFYGRNVLSMVNSRVMAGDAPDIIEQSYHVLGTSIKQNNNNAVDLKGMFYNEKGPEGQARLIDIFNEKGINLYERDGKILMFPYEFITSGFFYNKNLFAQYGLKEPTNWNEFMKNNELLKQNNIIPLAMDTNVYNNYYYIWIIDRILGPKALRKALEDTSGSTWDNPGYLKAAEMVYGLGKGGKNFFQEGYEKTEWPYAQYDWVKGKYGSILCYTWIPDETLPYAEKGFEYGFYPFPEIEGGKSKISDVEARYIGCSISAKSKKVDEAKAFLKFLVNKENAQRFVEISNRISARKDIPYPKVLSSIQNYINSAENFHDSEEEVYLDYPEWWSDVFLRLHTKLIIGELEPNNFIKKIKEESIKYMIKK